MMITTGIPLVQHHRRAPSGILQICPSLRRHMDAQGMEGEEWDELQRNLMATIPVYDRINRFATLGQVSRWRKMVREKLPQGTSSRDWLWPRKFRRGCGR